MPAAMKRPAFVYVVEWSNGEVKVGLTTNFKSRLRSLVDDRGRWGVDVGRHWCSEKFAHGGEAERAALRAMEAKAGMPTKGQETFIAKYDEALAWVQSATADFEPAVPETHEVSYGSFKGPTEITEAEPNGCFTLDELVALANCDLTHLQLRFLLFMAGSGEPDGVGVFLPEYAQKVLGVGESEMWQTLSELEGMGRLVRKQGLHVVARQDRSQSLDKSILPSVVIWGDSPQTG